MEGLEWSREWAEQGSKEGGLSPGREWVWWQKCLPNPKPPSAAPLKVYENLALAISLAHVRACL